jgi:hypothetical protein
VCKNNVLHESLWNITEEKQTNILSEAWGHYSIGQATDSAI